jgi:hypothetical protein
MLIIILICLIALIIYSYIEYNKEKEHFYPIYPYNVADAFYFPTNCMETLLDGVRCFPYWFY